MANMAKNCSLARREEKRKRKTTLPNKTRVAKTEGVQIEMNEDHFFWQMHLHFWSQGLPTRRHRHSVTLPI
jgi:hypothetical protein